MTDLRTRDTLKPLYFVLDRLIWLCTSRNIHLFFLFDLVLLVQLSDESHLELLKFVFVGFQGLVKRHKGGERLGHDMISACIGHFNEESDGH